MTPGDVRTAVRFLAGVPTDADKAAHPEWEGDRAALADFLGDLLTDVLGDLQGLKYGDPQ